MSLASCRVSPARSALGGTRTPNHPFRKGERFQLRYESVYDPSMDREMTFMQFMTRLEDDVRRFREHVFKMMREKPGLYDQTMTQKEWLKAFLRFIGARVTKSVSTRVR